MMVAILKIFKRIVPHRFKQEGEDRAYLASSPLSNTATGISPHTAYVTTSAFVDNLTLETVSEAACTCMLSENLACDDIIERSSNNHENSSGAIPICKIF